MHMGALGGVPQVPQALFFFKSFFLFLLLRLDDFNNLIFMSIKF